MNKNESFIYCVSSAEKLNSGTGNTYEIDVGKLNTSHDHFLVEVVSCSFGPANSFSGNDDQILLTVEGLAENYENYVNGNEAILTIANYTNTGMTGTNGAIFKAKDLRMGKRVTFKIRMLDLNLATSGTDINAGGNTTYWLLMLKFTPIEPF
jgi:hypothetical protein